MYIEMAVCEGRLYSEREREILGSDWLKLV